MALDPGLVNGLLGTGITRGPVISDLITGKNSNFTASLFSTVFTSSKPALTEAQESTLTNLENFISENVEGKDAERLQASLAGLRQLLQSGNQQQANLDPVFSLLAGDPTLAGGNAGSVIDLLL